MGVAEEILDVLAEHAFVVESDGEALLEFVAFVVVDGLAEFHEQFLPCVRRVDDSAETKTPYVLPGKIGISISRAGASFGGGAGASFRFEGGGGSEIAVFFVSNPREHRDRSSSVTATRDPSELRHRFGKPR